MENFRSICCILKICALLFVIINVSHTGSLQDSALQAHNEYRNSHGSPPLALDNEATKFAEKHAETLVRLGKLKHTSPGGKYGENLYFEYGEPLPDDSTIIKNAVKSWYDEISSYNYNKPRFTGATGHFSQVVWKDSKLLGIGLRRNADGKKAFVVAEYYPPGNIVNPGQFSKNVLKPTSTSLIISKVTEFVSLFWPLWPAL